MSKKEFEAFLKNQQRIAQKSKEEKVDWSAKKKEWLTQIDCFYTIINGFLENYIDKKEIILEYQEIEITEQYLGKYTTRKLMVKLGVSEVTFLPIGSLVIGARGRIDMSSSFGTVKFVLIDRNVSEAKIIPNAESTLVHLTEIKPNDKQPVKLEWKILAHPPMTKFINITQETFFNVFMEVVNGK